MERRKNTNFRAQSAMEYLMTYGWAILIIAVVLGALFSLGLFNTQGLLGTSCVATPGWLCSSPILSHTTGALSFTLGQNNGYQIGNIIIACAAASNTLGLPVATGAASFATPNVLSYNGFFIVQSTGISNTPGGTVAANSPPGAILASGATITISYLPCFQSSGTATNAVLPFAIGSGFQGSIWVGFNSTGSTGSINTVSKVATISVKSS